MTTPPAIESIAQKISTMYDLDLASVECALKGTIERVQAAASKGELMTVELVEGAFMHWFQCQQRYFHDLLDNQNGEMDLLRSRVLEQIAQEKE